MSAASIRMRRLLDTSGRTFCVDPLCVQVGQDSLIALLLETLGRLLVHQTAASPPPRALPDFGISAHLLLGRLDTGRSGRLHLFGEGDAVALEDCGRQFGGVARGRQPVRGYE